MQSESNLPAFQVQPIHSTDETSENPNKMFLGGLPVQATEKMLVDFFSEYGKVTDVRIVTDRVTAESKGYGFVTFADDENVERLVAQKAVRLCGKKVRVRRALRKNGSQFDYLINNKLPQPAAGSSFFGSQLENKNPYFTPPKCATNIPFNDSSVFMTPPDESFLLTQGAPIGNFSSFPDPTCVSLSPTPQPPIHQTTYIICPCSRPRPPMYYRPRQDSCPEEALRGVNYQPAYPLAGYQSQNVFSCGCLQQFQRCRTHTV